MKPIASDFPYRWESYMVSDRQTVTEESTDPVGAFTEFAGRVSQLREYAAFYLSAQFARIRLTVRALVIYAIMGVVGLIAAATVVITAVVLTCNGLANGLGAAFGGRVWLGEFITGILLLAATAAVVYVGVAKVTKTFKTATVAEYERRKQQQRTTYGADVTQQHPTTPTN